MALAMTAIPASADSPPSERPGPLPGEIEVTETVRDVSPQEAGMGSAFELAAAQAPKCKEQTVTIKYHGGDIRFTTSTIWCYRDNEIVNSPTITFAGTTHGGGWQRRWHYASRTGGGKGQPYHSDRGEAGFCIPHIPGPVPGNCNAGNEVLWIEKSQYADGRTTKDADHEWRGT